MTIIAYIIVAVSFRGASRIALKIEKIDCDLKIFNLIQEKIFNFLYFPRN
jgi:hypothetical protein